MTSLVLAILALLAGPAELTWEADEGCPSEVELDQAIAGWLAREPAGEPVRAVGRVFAGPGAWRLELRVEVGARSNTHVLRAHDCAALTERAAFLIASAIDPFALGGVEALDHVEPAELDAALAEAIVVRPPPVQRPRRPAPAPALDVPELEVPELDVPELDPPELAELDPPVRTPEFGPLSVDLGEPGSRPRPRVEAFLAVSGLGVAGLFQRPSGGAELLVGLDRGALRIAIGAAGWLGGGFRAADDPEVGGDLQAASGVVEVCGVPKADRAGRVQIPLCVTSTAGAIVGTGVGVADPATLARPWVAAGGDVGVRWRVHPRVALRLGVGVLASLVRPVWALAGPEVSFTTPPLFGRLRLGIEPILTRPGRI